MKIYRLKNDYAHHGKSTMYTAKLRHRYALPGVNCTICGNTWGNPALAYPHVNLEDFIDAKDLDLYKSSWAVSLWFYEQLRHLLSHLLPPELPIKPGAGFGPLVGTATGTFNDYFMVKPGTLLITDKLLEKLMGKGVRGLVNVKLDLKSSSPSADGLREMYIQPEGYIIPSPLSASPSCCIGCGAILIPWSSETVVDKDFIPDSIDIFRGLDAPASVFVTENFVASALESGAIGLHFEPVNTV